jgi:hypothetical protein
VLPYHAIIFVRRFLFCFLAPFPSSTHVCLSHTVFRWPDLALMRWNWEFGDALIPGNTFFFSECQLVP